MTLGKQDVDATRLQFDVDFGEMTGNHIPTMIAEFNERVQKTMTALCQQWTDANPGVPGRVEYEWVPVDMVTRITVRPATEDEILTDAQGS